MVLFYFVTAYICFHIDFQKLRTKITLLWLKRVKEMSQRPGPPTKVEIERRMNSYEKLIQI